MKATRLLSGDENADDPLAKKLGERRGSLPLRLTGMWR